jgi:hypothetical protein
MESQQLLEAAATATSESSSIDFKSAFDHSQRGDWCELIKDIVAMANSGGGCIVLGVADDGTRSSWDPAVIAQLDPAQVSDQVRKYVEGLDDMVAVTSVSRGGATLPAIAVSASPVPRVFTNPGNYDKGGGKQTQAFPKGGLYFRHGAKSEPAEQADLSAAIERAIDCVRSKWLGNIRQVMEAPPGAQVQVITSEVRASVDPAVTAIRVVDDPSAPAYRVVRPDDTHPYRQKELVAEVNKRGNGAKINGFDVQCVRRMLDGDNAHPEFFHEPKFGSKQYSAAFVEYIVNGCAADPEFIVKARSAAKQPKK